jgi:hypothetical protein
MHCCDAIEWSIYALKHLSSNETAVAAVCFMYCNKVVTRPVMEKWRKFRDERILYLYQI